MALACALDSYSEKAKTVYQRQINKKVRQFPKVFSKVTDGEDDAQEVRMEKISGILPESPRLRAEKESLRPVRPGAPGFGRTEGSSDIRDRVNISSIKNIGTPELQTYKNPKEAKHVKIVDDLNRKFFGSQASGNKEVLRDDVLLPLSNPIESHSIELDSFDDQP